MNRRGFLGSLIAGAVMLAAPKLPLPAAVAQFPKTMVVNPLDVWDLRRQMRASLTQWFAEEFDRLMLAELTRQA